MAHNGETRKWSRVWWFLWWWRDSRHGGGEGLRRAKGEANPQPPVAGLHVGVRKKVGLHGVFLWAVRWLVVASSSLAAQGGEERKNEKEEKEGLTAPLSI